MYGRIVNKKARYNLCYGDECQEPDYQHAKGRVVAYEDVPLLKKMRERLCEVVGQKANNLVAEGNYYYDLSQCGIGFHGDAERKKVIAVRLGADCPLDYHWFYRNAPIGYSLHLYTTYSSLM